MRKGIFFKVTLITTIARVVSPATAMAAGNLVNVSTNNFTDTSQILVQNNESGFEYENFEFWSEQCLFLEENQEYETALTACEKAISLAPGRENYEIWSARSNILFQLQRYPEAIVSYNQLLRVEPNDSLALTHQCMAFINLGNYENAINACEEGVRINGNWGDSNPALAWYHLGLAFKMLGRIQEAFIAYERALFFDPNYHLALAERLSLGPELAPISEAEESQEEQVIRAYELALEENPEDWVTWKNQGIYLLELGKYEQALISFDQVITLIPDYSLVLGYKCQIKNQLKQYQEALEICNQALEGNGDWENIRPGDVWYQKSLSLLSLEQYTEAIAAAERSLNLKPEQVEAWNNIAVSFWHLGKYNEAENAAQNALKLNDEYAQGQFNLGIILSALKDYKKAIEAYNNALKYEFIPGNFTCSQIVENLQQDIGVNLKEQELICSDILTNQAIAIWNDSGCYNIVSENSTNCQNAFQPSKDATLVNPESFEAWYNFSFIARKLAKESQKESQENEQALSPYAKDLYQQALYAYEQADILLPEQVSVVTGQGICLENLGEYAKALFVFETALELEPDYELAQQGRNRVLEKLNNSLNQRIN